MTPNYSFFIRTYPKDYEWLTYCLRSLRKFAPSVPIVVAFPHTRQPPTLEGVHPDNITTVSVTPVNINGYIDQQITKLCADVHVGAEFVVFIDSDTVLTDTPDKLFINGKPLMIRTPYAQLTRETEAWKVCTEKELGMPVSHEYMRRLPLVYPVELLPRLRDFIQEKNHSSYQEWAETRTKLSEFNLLGAYAYEFMRDAFLWIDTDVDPVPPAVAKQFWSWGGIKEHRAWLEANYPKQT